MRPSKTSACLAVVVAGLLPLACNPVADDSRSVATLALDFDQVAALFSDVVDATGQTADDIVDVKVTSVLKAPGQTANDLYTVDIFAYRVSFTRPDGRNEPGVDVPFPVTLPIGAPVPPGGEGTFGVIVVTKEMKLEAPLRGLWFGDGNRIFTQARVEVFGVDRLQNAASASGSFLVTFEDR